MTIIENLDKAANHVLGATRTRYTERVADTTVVNANANSKGLTATCKGTADYEVFISADYSPFSTKENPVGAGAISCTCEAYKRMNPKGTPIFKLDPCKHINAVAHRWVNRMKADKGAEEAKEVAKPTHLKFEGLKIEAESDKAIKATIGGVEDWYPKGHIIVKGEEIAIACWLADAKGCKGGEPIVVKKSYKGGWRVA